MTLDVYTTDNLRAGKICTERGEQKPTHDDATGGLKVITTDHNNIHRGEGFEFAMRAAGVADGAGINLELTTASAGYVHLKLMIPWGEGGLNTFSLLEGHTSTGGSAATLVNKRRTGTPPVASSTLKTQVTPSNGATLAAFYFGGGGTGQGTAGDRSLDNEWVLKPSTKYLIRLTNNSGAAKALSLYMFLYEEESV